VRRNCGRDTFKKGQLRRHNRIGRRESVEMRPQFRHLPLQPVEHRRSVRQRGLLAGFRAPAKPALPAGFAFLGLGSPKRLHDCTARIAPRIGPACLKLADSSSVLTKHPRMSFDVGCFKNEITVVNLSHALVVE
jgi:hypothetical protein